MPLYRTFSDVTGAMAHPVDNTDPKAHGPKASGLMGNQAVVRLFAALVMIPPVLACIYFGYPAFNVLVIIIVAVMAWEWRRLVTKGTFDREGVFFALFLVAALIAGSLSQYQLALAFLGIVAVLFALKSMMGSDNQSSWMTFGVLYIGLPTLALIWIRGDGDSGRYTVFWLFALVWAADTGAYVAGRLIGGPKLMPRVSPNKTWAGLAGCVSSAALVGVATAYFFSSVDILTLALFSGVIGLVSQAGDLIESAIKRHFGVKDSSHLIPGHGGILDRVDALLTAILVAALIKLAYGGNIIEWS